MAVFLVVFLHICHVSPRAVIPGVHVSFVDAVDPSPTRNADVFVGKEKLAKARVQGKTIYAMPGGIDHHGARTINEIAGSHLVDAFLQAVFDTPVRRVVRHASMDREYRANAGI